MSLFQTGPNFCLRKLDQIGVGKTVLDHQTKDLKNLWASPIYGLSGILKEKKKKKKTSFHT